MAESSFTVAATAAPDGCLDENTAADYVAHRLAPSSVDAVDAHLAGCEACRRWISALARCSLVPDVTACTPSPDTASELDGPWVQRPARLGRYVVLEELGRGGMGHVVAAYDRELDRRVAVKVIDVVHGSAEGSARARARLIREAQALARLNHPNVVEIHDVGIEGDRAFVAMELLDGPTLEVWMRARRRSWREVLDVFVEAGQGLAAAHRRGIVHRDFKPANVVLADGRPRVVDFGLARPAAERDLDDRTVDDAAVASSTTLTRPGALVGTPAYMAPEQLRGLPADARSDQFAFCVALFEALYDRRPFTGRTLAELSASVLHGEIAVASDRSVPRWLRSAVVRGLTVDASQRWPSMDALLRRLAAGRSGRRTLTLVGAVGVVAATTGALGFGAAAAPEPCPDPDAHVDAMWGPARSHAVQQTVRSSDPRHGADTWSRIDAKMADYSERWAAHHAETCAAGRAGTIGASAFDARMQCLLRRQQEAVAVTELLATPRAVERLDALPMVTRLPEVDACAEVMAGARPGPAADPAMQPRTDAVLGEIARVRALRDAGRYAEGVALAGALEPKVAALDSDPLRAELAFWRGSVLASDGRDAIASFHDAAWLATTLGDLDLAATAMLDLAGEVGLNRDGDPAAAQRWVEYARRIIERAGDPPALRRELHRARGNLAYAAGDYEAALVHHERAIELAETTLAADAPELATRLEDLALDLAELGRLDDALPVQRRALAIYERSVGPHHPWTAAGLEKVGHIMHASGRYREAEPVYRRSLAIREDVLGPKHLEVSAGLTNLAGCLLAMGEPEAALPMLERALAIDESQRPEHPGLAPILNNIANAHRLMRRPEVARPLYERGADLLARTVGSGHPHRAVLLSGLSAAELELKRYDAALALARETVAIRSAAFGPDDPRLAIDVMNVGLAELELGRPRDALQTLLRAQALADPTVGDPALGPEIRLAIAQTRWALGEHDTARALGLEAAAAYAATGLHTEADVAAAVAWVQDPDAS